MTADADLARLATRAGLHPSFRDMNDVERPMSPDTQRALLAANGLAAKSPAQVRETLALLEHEAANRFVPQDVIVRAGVSRKLPVAEGVLWSVVNEAGNALYAEGISDGAIDLPALDVGIYVLHIKKKSRHQSATLLVAPEKAPDLAQIAGSGRDWGVVAALYGLRSARHEGMGDYRDLAETAATLGGAGAGFLGINPVHALGWAAVETISPYSPTHRAYLNTGHIALDRISPDAGPVGAQTGDLLEYDLHRTAHRQALSRAFDQFQKTGTQEGTARFEAFCSKGGADLQAFATYEVLSTELGADARKWPEGTGAGDALARGLNPSDLRFHLWLQWVAAEQLAEAQDDALQSGMRLGLYLDLAVGARLGGAEYWANHAVRAQGVSVGAPPDDLSPAGQNWGLCAYAPRPLSASRYAALRHILRQNMEKCGLLRIDHALGLNRSFWLPDDGTPGGYISQPFDALLAVVQIEAWQTGTVVVGEDLGLVPDGFRSRMQETGLYGYTVLQFEKEKTGAFRKAKDVRPHSLACFGTHDTPTLRGFWEGADIAWWRKLGWIAPQDEPEAQSRRDVEKENLAGAGTKEDAHDLAFKTLRKNVHQTLADAPTALAAVQLDDLFAQREAQNLPGTIDEHPNWRRRYPRPVTDAAFTEALTETAALMRAGARIADAAKSRKDAS